VIPYSILFLVWTAAFVGLLGWSLAKKSRLIGGGLALVAVSLVPMMYGRWITTSEWHDSPLMVVYYLPTMLAGFLSLIIIIVGLVMKARQALLTRGGPQ
jgi:hypothetical protein